LYDSVPALTKPRKEITSSQIEQLAERLERRASINVHQFQGRVRRRKLKKVVLLTTGEKFYIVIVIIFNDNRSLLR
jgi:hypothetical protein